MLPAAPGIRGCAAGVARAKSLAHMNRHPSRHQLGVVPPPPPPPDPPGPPSHHPLSFGCCRQIVNAALNVLIGISRAPHLEVKAITYPAIGNEWLDWLREVEEEEGREGLHVAAPPALMARRASSLPQTGRAG